MEINMKEYNFKSFKQKDLYTWKEITDTIYDLESQIYALQEEKDDLERQIANMQDPDCGKPDPFDEYMENQFQNE